MDYHGFTMDYHGLRCTEEFHTRHSRNRRSRRRTTIRTRRTLGVGQIDKTRSRRKASGLSRGLIPENLVDPAAPPFFRHRMPKLFWSRLQHPPTMREPQIPALLADNDCSAMPSCFPSSVSLPLPAPPITHVVIWSEGAEGAKGCLGDALASAVIVGSNLQIQGTSLTGAQIGFVIAEPVDGWSNGVVVPLNPSSLPQAGAYTATDGGSYTTLQGGNTTFQINYIDPVSGGYVVGTFQGSMQDALGNTITVSGGQYAMPID